MATRLRDACRAITAGASLHAQLPDVLELERLNRKSDAAPSGALLRKPSDPAQVAVGIANAVYTGAALSRRQLRDAPWCLWAPEIRLAERREVLLPVLEAIARAESAMPFRALAGAYVDAFDPAMPGLDAASHCLRQLSSERQDAWGALQRDFDFFDAEAGPKRLAAEVIRQDRSVTDILRTYGLQAIAAQSGYARGVTAALLESLADGAVPNHIDRLERVQRYGLSGDGRPLFAEHVPRIATALLRPFLRQAPEQITRDSYLTLILKLFGDPRLRGVNWMGIDPSLKQLVTSWLTEQSLRQFLDIVDQTALERMWRYRRAFWESVYEAGLIEEAWVAFGVDGKRLARAKFGREVQFAELLSHGRQIEAGHAVLLLRIGAAVVADWSHNGKCNIWFDAASPEAPRLYSPRYGSDRVRIAHHGTSEGKSETVSFSHTSSDTYGWQAKAAEYLYRMTGRRISQADYRVRR